MAAVKFDTILGKLREADITPQQLDAISQAITGKSDKSQTGNTIALTFDSTTKTLSATLKNISGQNIGTASVVIPMENNLVIGTQAQRLACTPFEGMEWNETGGDAIVRYLYENSQWRIIESPETSYNEHVTLHISTYDGLGTLLNHVVGVTDNATSIATNYQLDANGECSFDITKGHTYTIAVASLTGYHNLPEQTFRAANDNKTITMTFLAAATQFETVVFSVCAYNSQFVPSASLQNQFVGDTVTMNIQGGSDLTAIIGSDYKATFQVPYGSVYTINTPTKSGFMKIYQKTFTNTASLPQRAIPSHYITWSGSNILVLDLSSGQMYDYETVEAMSAAEITELKAHAALYMNTSVLQQNNASFAFKVPAVTSSQAWAGSNVAFNPELLPYKPSHAAAVTCFNGPQNTQYIKDIGDSLGVSTPAADWCSNQVLTVNNTSTSGYLGEYGEMKTIADNAAQIIAFEILLGLTQTNFASGYWWTSTQYSANNAVSVINGQFHNNTKTSPYTTMALFRPFS